jgi:hypothetical protein
MKGYLMQDREWVPGEDLFLESHAPENAFGVVFEDDGDAAYFYAVERETGAEEAQVLDALHIHQRDEEDEVEEKRKLQIIWSRDWLKCALVIDGRCHALYDFDAHGGYNINEFPPPNGIWTRGDRKLTDEIVKRLF